MMWAVLEGSALFAVAIAFVGVPLWLVWAGIAAGRDTRIAYGIVGALCLFQTVAFSLLTQSSRG